MILELVGFDLLNVVLAQNHVLNELSYLLVELNDVWLLVHEFLDHAPLRKLGVHLLFLRATLESAH